MTDTRNRGMRDRSGRDGLRWRTMYFRLSEMISTIIFIVLVTFVRLNCLNGLNGSGQVAAVDDFSYQGEHPLSKQLIGQSLTSTRDVRLKVTTVLVAPYVMVAGVDGNRTKSPSGVVRYEGFIVDLMDAVCAELGLRYQMTPTADGEYGHQTTDGSWNGMVNQLINKEVDIAAAALYVTDQREEVVDFSLPFLIVQATILLKKPPTGSTGLVQSVVDLLKSPGDFTYGTLNTGLILRAFRTTNVSLHRTIYENIRRFHPPAFTASNDEGIERARRTNYAFILPHTIGDYVSRRFPCDIITVDKFLMKERFALAVPKGSGLLPQLNRAIRVLLDNGFLGDLYTKWLLDKSDCNGIQSSKMYSSGNSAGNKRTSDSLSLCVPLSVLLLILGTRFHCARHDCISLQLEQ